MSIPQVIIACVLTALVLLVTFCVLVGFLADRIQVEKVNNQVVMNKHAPKNSIVFLGDSLTDFYPINDFLRAENLINRGIANDETCDVKKRLSGILLLNPKVCFLQIGINDVIHACRPVNAQVVADRITELVSTIQPFCEVKLISLYPVNPRKKLHSRLVLMFARNKKIVEINNILKQFCVEHNVDFIDLYSVLTDENGLLDKRLTNEGLHLNMQGYATISPIIQQYLDNL